MLPFINICTERNGDLQACQQSECFSESNVYQQDLETGWNGEYFRKLRLDLLNGIENPNCFRCWQANERGIESKRTHINAITEYRRDAEFLEKLEECKNNDGHFDLAPEQLDIKISNTCNLKCMMCNPYQSSQHVVEVQRMRKDNEEPPKWIQFIEQSLGDKTKPPKGKISTHVKSMIGKVQRLLIDGGEPMTSPDLEEILDFCIEEEYTDLHISFVTNLTNVPLPILEKLNRFKQVDLYISWDHYDPEYFKFIRYPADYNAFLENFETVCNYPNINLGISLAVSIFNIYNIPKLLDVFKTLKQEGKLKLEVIYKLVHAPDTLSIEYLEPDQKEYLNAMLANYISEQDNPLTITDIENSAVILKHTPKDFEEVCIERTRILELYDRVRGTNYQKLFPFIKSYYEPTVSI